MNYEHSRSGPDKDVTRYRQLQAHRCEITRGIAANLINFGGANREHQSEEEKEDRTRQLCRTRSNAMPQEEIPLSYKNFEVYQM
jgi:hypothetical protein